MTAELRDSLAQVQELDHDTKYYRKPWMSDDQWECAKLSARLHGGFHHMAQVKEWGAGIKVQTYPHRLATFDFNMLTELVFAAHDECIRIEIAQGGPGRVALVLHKRHEREGNMCVRHPTLETAVAKWRERNHGPKLMKMLDDRSAELTTAWMAGAERERERAARDVEDAGGK